MRNPARSMALLASSIVLGLAGCNSPDQSLDPSLATAPGGCNVVLSYFGPKTLSVPANSTNNNASWFISNEGSSSVTLNSQTPTKGGAVTAVRKNVWAPFPYTLRAGSQIDADVSFDVGASGTGTVGLTVSSSCGSLVLPVHTVSIQVAPTSVFPVGMSKGVQTDLLGMSYTPDGQMITGSVTGVTNTLNAARAAHARITLRVTGGNDNFQTNGDKLFVLSKWKTAFDVVKNMDVRGYVTDGTLLGHYAIDEPFSDFTNMTPDLLEQMCQYQKSFIGWSTVPCVVRELNTRLYSERPTSTFKYAWVDAGWAQLTDHQYVPLNKYDGDIGAYYRDNVAQGRLVNLGLIYGFNLIAGGREFAGCDKPFGTDVADHNCAMTAAEVREMTDTLVAIGPSKGCGIIGYEIDAAGPDRDYFFSTGAYVNNGIQSAIQYMSSKLRGLQGAPCKIR